MSKEKCDCNKDYEYDLDYYDYECDCDCHTKSKIVKIGACIGGIAILGGIITALVLKKRKVTE